MPTSTTCLWEGESISIKEALRIRKKDPSPLFLCVHCGERVKAHSGGGHTKAHFEHKSRNKDCPLSHSDSYKYGGSQKRSGKKPTNTEEKSAIEGYAKERKSLAHHRNASLVTACKERDKYTCQACGFNLRVRGRSIVECHHLAPLASSGKRVTSVDDLATLCPNCHRIAHTSEPPLSVKEISKIAKRL